MEHCDALEVEVCQDIDLLRAQWLELETRSTTHSAAQTFAYAAQAWEAISKKKGDQLAIVTIRRAGRLICVWPLYVAGERWKRVAKHLGNGSLEEYGAPLVDDGENTVDLAVTVLRRARRLADLLIVQNVPSSRPLATAVTADRSIRCSWSDFSSIVDLKAVANWESWLANKSKWFRYTLRRERNLLAREGDLRSVRMAGPVDGPRFADWMFDQKRNWLYTRQIGQSWLRGAQARNLYAALLSREVSDTPQPGEAVALAITLDGRIIAGAFSLLSPDRLEFFVTVFDPRYARFRPGNLLNEDHVRWAVANGVDFDFRTMVSHYKDRWADRREPCVSAYLACSWRGVLAVASQNARAQLRRGRRSG